MLAGVLLGVLLQPGFALIGLPAMTAPFILACWLVLAAKRLMGLAQPARSL
ncbi:Urea transporter [compost metagenome]